MRAAATVPASASGIGTRSAAERAASVAITAMARAGMAQVRMASPAAMSASGARGGCFARAGARLREAEGIVRIGGAAFYLSAPGGASCNPTSPRERHLLEVVQAAEHDAPVLLRDHAVVLEP